MILRYSFDWYIQQFDEAKETAENFLLSVDDSYFLKPPAQNKWCVAECYHHLIKFGYIYHRNLSRALQKHRNRVHNVDQSFRPRWLWKKTADFFEPPYSIRLKTMSSMEPEVTADYNRLELLDEFMELQDQFIAQLEHAKNEHIDLGGTKISHPVIGFLKLTFSEYYLLTIAHQRRHHWQAEQTLSAVREKYENPRAG